MISRKLPRVRNTSIGLVLALSLIGLTACGKKSDPMPPEGEEANYTYPSVYPTPKSVSPVAAQGELLKASPDWTDEGQVDSSRSKTKTYGPKLPQ